MNIMQVSGKQIKDYVVREPVASRHDVHLLAATSTHQHPFSILVIDKKLVDQSSFVAYNNLLQENRQRIHPEYIEPIQSTNNIYIVLEHLRPIPGANISYRDILPSLVQLYRNVGEYKIDAQELFLTDTKRIVYLPFYKDLQTSSKFYAQFHNKSVLGEVFASSTPLPKNRALEIFLQLIDSPNPTESIALQVSHETSFNLTKNQYQSISQTHTVGANNYPSLEMEEEKDDEEILRLMSEAKVNNELKKEAGDIFKRQSVKRFEEQSDKELNHIMQQAKSSMPIIKKAEKSQYLKSKMEVKLSASKIEGNQFDVYFRSYFESLRFLKKSIKVFLEYYRNGFAGIVSSYLIITILALRKAYMIKDLECGIDIFDLNINMANVPVKKYIALISHDLKSETRMIVELRNLIQNCQMPMKTFGILAPFLEEDVSAIDLEQLQSFTFFFLSALMKGRETGKMHFLYFIDVMYILLHKNYQIAFFESEFPKGWDQTYFQTKVALIEAILPGWRMR